MRCIAVKLMRCDLCHINAVDSLLVMRCFISALMRMRSCDGLVSAPCCPPALLVVRCGLICPPLHLSCLPVYVLHLWPCAPSLFLLHSSCPPSLPPLTFSAQELPLGAPSLLHLCSFMSLLHLLGTPSLVLLAPSLAPAHSFMCSYHVSLALSMLS